MYKFSKATKSSLIVNKSYEGETIEQKMRRVLNNKEPITDGAPLVYTERKDGVQPQYDIRTDRWEIALDAHENIAKARLAQREAKGKVIKMDNKDTEPKTGEETSSTDGK